MAQCHLGVMLANSQVGGAINSEALQWMKSAADQGEPLALYNLGLMYQEGGKSEPDHEVALDCFRQAACQGQADAQVALGWMYAKGQAVLQDYVRAHMWFNLAATHAHADAYDGREFVSKLMPPAQIAQAQEMARSCKQNNYQGFD
jgi:TPR repeat protein